MKHDDSACNPEQGIICSDCEKEIIAQLKNEVTQ